MRRPVEAPTVAEMNVSLPAVNSQAEAAPNDRHELVEEVVRYLAAVDLFRELGHEPTWRRELRRS